MAGISKEERARRAEQAKEAGKTNEQASQQPGQSVESLAPDANQQDGQQGSENTPGGDPDPDTNAELGTQSDAEIQNSEGDGTKDEKELQVLIAMYRDEPEIPGHPTIADVHPDEVENWKAAGWKKQE